MKRTTAREIAVRLCFALSENSEDPMKFLKQTFNPEYYETLKEEDKLYSEPPDNKQMEYITRVVAGVREHVTLLDGFIEKYSVGWKPERISGTAMAIMQVALFEVLYMSDVPERAAINEAVELAKKYENPETCAFINGILGSFSRAKVLTEAGIEFLDKQEDEAVQDG